MGLAAACDRTCPDGFCPGGNWNLFLQRLLPTDVDLYRVRNCRHNLQPVPVLGLEASGREKPKAGAE